VKRIKKALVSTIKCSSYYYKYKCPYCGIYHDDHCITEKVIRIKCSHCQNIIDLEFVKENSVEKSNL
jgi:ribosomal protein S27E